MSKTGKSLKMQFIHLLRCALWDEKPDKQLFDYGTDWQGIMLLAQRHTVQGLVAQKMKRMADILGHEAAMKLCAKEMFKASNNNRHLNKVSAMLTAVLRDGGIEPVLLKGQGVARYYPEPLLRMPGDIDFFIGVERTDEAAAMLSEKLPGIKRHHGRNDKKHVNMTMDGVEIELHRMATGINIMAKAQEIQDWTEEQLRGDTRQATIAGCVMTVPSATFDAIYIFYHLYRHFLVDGVGLRHVCDWLRCLYANRADIDEEGIRQLLTRFGLLHAWQLFGLMAVRHLGMPREAMPLYRERRAKSADRLLQVLINNSNFGKEQKLYERENKPRNVVAAKIFSKWLHFRYHSQHLLLFPRQAVPLMLHLH